MKQKTRTDLKTIIIALMIALGTNHVITFIHTLLGFILGDEYIRAPLTFYFARGNLNLILAGGYIAFSRSDSRTLLSIITGPLYTVLHSLYVYLFFTPFDFQTPLVIRMLNSVIIDTLLITGAYAVTEYVKRVYRMRKKE